MLSLIEAVLRRRAGIVAAVLGLTAAAAPGVLRLESDNSPEVFLLRDAHELERYARLRRDFGNDQAVRIIVGGERLWSAEGLVRLCELEVAAGDVAGVDDARGLCGHLRRPRTPWPPAEPEALREAVVGDPLARGLGWVSRDGARATVLVILARRPPAERRAALRRLEGLLTGSPPGVTAHLAGLPVINRALDASAADIPRRFFPLLIAFAVALLTTVFRDVRDLAAPLIFVGVCQGILLGTMGWLGVRLNLVLVLLAPLVFVIALATAVHLTVRYRDFRERGGDPATAILETWRDKGWAVLWTGLTTLAGFASLAISELPPVRALGLWSGAGMALTTALAFAFYPALLAVLGSGERPPRRRWLERVAKRRGRDLARWAATHRGWVLAAAALLIAVGLTGLPRLRVESNALHYLPPEHPLRLEVRALERAGIGVAALQLVLEDPSPAETLGFQSVAGLRSLEALTAELRQLPEVVGAVGAGDIMAAAVRRAAPPGAELDDTLRAYAMAGLRRDRGERQRLESFVTWDGERSRIVVTTAMMGFDRFDPLAEDLLRRARRSFPAARVEITGELALLLAAKRRLLATLGLSIGVTLAVVALTFRLLLPSTRLVLLALVPNLWPLALVLGGMGWVGVPVSIGTVMVGAVVLGLAVDDTIHTLGHFRELAPVEGRFAAVATTLERTAPAYLLTGLILAAGFAVCGLSDFVPTARFGAVSAVAVSLAVVADLVLLPALIGSTPQAVVERLGRPRA